jgi:hypothetical protein
MEVEVDRIVKVDLADLHRRDADHAARPAEGIVELDPDMSDEFADGEGSNEEAEALGAQQGKGHHQSDRRRCHARHRHRQPERPAQVLSEDSGRVGADTEEDDVRQRPVAGGGSDAVAGYQDDVDEEDDQHLDAVLADHERREAKHRQQHHRRNDIRIYSRHGPAPTIPKA